MLDSKTFGRNRIFRFEGESFLLSFFYIVTVYYVYSNSIYPFYSYMGYTFNSLSVFQLISVAILPAFLSVFLPKNISSISSFFCVIYFFQVLLPVLSMPFYILENVNFIYWLPLWGVMIVFYIFLINLDKIKTINFNYCFNSEFSRLSMYTISTISFLILYFSYGVNFSGILSVADVSGLYDIRMDYREANQSVNTVAKYLFAWSAKVITPFLLIYSILSKNRKLFICAFIFQFSIFAINGQKSIALGLFVVFSLYFVLNKKNSGVILFRLIVLSVIFFNLIDLIFDIDFFTNVLVRRVFLTSGILTSYYVDFYSVNDLHYYANSSLSFFSELNYSVPAPFVIGLNYFNSEIMAANSNFVASSYANLGLIGVAFEGAFLLIVLYFINSITSCNDSRLIFSMFILPLMSLADSALLNSIFTHGIFFAVIFFFLVKGVVRKEGV